MRAIRDIVVAVTVAALVASVPSPAFAARSAAAVAKELASARSEVATVGRQYDRALAALEITDDKIEGTDKRLKKEQKKLEAAEALLNARVDTMYRNGDDAELIGVLLGATTFEDFITRADLVSKIGEKDAALVLDLKETRKRLERNKRDLAAQRKKRAADFAAFSKKRASLVSRLAKVQGRYDSLLQELAAAMERERASGRRTYYPKGPNGMVFPVRGANYYSNTWGASRGGGTRRHKGTDVMASRGVPIVAVMGGTARVHYSGLGGKSITITSPNGWQFYYAHLNAYAIRGGTVRTGQLIGYVGNTGNARGGASHLHFQMGPGGRWVNPYPYLRQMQ